MLYQLSYIRPRSSSLSKSDYSQGAVRKSRAFRDKPSSGRKGFPSGSDLRPHSGAAGGEST